MNTFFQNLIARFKEWRERRQQELDGDGLDVRERIGHELEGPNEISDRLRRQLRDDLRERRRHHGNGRMRW